MDMSLSKLPHMATGALLRLYPTNRRDATAKFIVALETAGVFMTKITVRGAGRYEG
jgi:hypothetical protein